MGVLGTRDKASRKIVKTMLLLSYLPLMNTSKYRAVNGRPVQTPDSDMTLAHGTTALGRTRYHCPFGVTSLIPFCNSRATWSEVNLNPCPSGMRSADTGYLGRRGSMPVILNSSRPVLN